MAGVQFPLDMSRLYRNIPQRHNKELFDFWHRRAERPDPSQERAQLSAQLRLQATPGEERPQHRDYRFDFGAIFVTSGQKSNEPVFHPLFEGLPVGVGPCG